MCHLAQIVQDKIRQEKISFANGKDCLVLAFRSRASVTPESAKMAGVETGVYYFYNFLGSLALIQILGISIQL